MRKQGALLARYVICLIRREETQMHHGKLAFLLSTGIMLGLASGTVPVYAETTDTGTLPLGNSAASLLAGGEVLVRDNVMYTADEDSISFRTSDGGRYLLTEDKGGSLNLSGDRLWYASGRVIHRIHLDDYSTDTMLTWYSDIDELAVVDGRDAYFLADGNIYLLNAEGEVSVVSDDGDINGFAPTRYGIITQKGELFDRALYADGSLVQDGVFSWDVSDGKLIVSIDGNDYENDLEDVFSEDDTSENFVLYAGASVGLDEIFVDGSCEECEHNGEITGQDELNAQQAEAEASESDESYIEFLNEDGLSADDEEAVAISAFASVSTGQKNIVRRAKQQLNIKWTPKKNIIGWANETVFEKGVTYRGIPYGQAIYARYIPYEEDNQTIYTGALQLFLDKVNDVNSKMYTSYSSYNKRAPYYSSDCSAFASYCWNISRTTTSALMYRANRVSDQSIYGIQIGDIMNKPDKHVVIVTDVGYTSSGRLSYIDISEQTPPIAKTTRYGSGGIWSLAEITAKYFAQGYTLYRNPNVNKVSFVESSAVSVGSISIGKNIEKAVSNGNNITLTSTRSSTGGVTSDQLGNRRDMIIRLYRHVLGRTPSDREIDGWMANLKNGSYTGAELAAHFYFGAEGKGVIKDDTEFVRRLYRAMFARTPKESEVKAWTNQNKLRWQYFKGFVASQEFIAICNDCAIDSGTFDGTYLMEMYRDVKTFVERLYNCCLERKTDRSGLISWTCAIAGGDIGGSRAAFGFFFSDEFKQLRTDNYDYVTRLYRTFFDRKPDSEGYNSWIKSLKSGNSRENVLNGFAKSKEYANLCAKYGITP
jgi:hypothetical protein